jgi:hypothetical protein
MMQLLDQDNETLPLAGGAFRIEEASTYRLVIGPGTTGRVWLGERELPWNAEMGGVVLAPTHWVGTTALKIQTGGAVHLFPLEVRPREEKLDPDEWELLLGDLESWVPAVTVGFEGGSQGAVGLSGAQAPSLAMALGPMVPRFIEALRSVVGAPRQFPATDEQSRRLHEIRRVSSRVLRWTVRHPATWQHIRGEALPEEPEPSLPMDVTQAGVDHPVNRYVVWLVRRVVASLENVVRTLQKQAKVQGGANEDTGAWCEARASVIENGVTALNAVLARSELARLPPAPPTEAALLILVDDPVYARLHRLGRLLLRPQFQLPATMGSCPAPVRPSYDLYELWCFLTLRRHLGAALPNAGWTDEGLDFLRLLNGTGEGAECRAGLLGGGELTLLFNPTFPGWLSRGSSSRWSISGERRPDIVVHYRSPDGSIEWLCLDAKYRVSRTGIADAFGSAHIYRDALRWTGAGPDDAPKRVRGAVLLVPRMDDACEPWFTPEFLADNGVGVFALSPRNGPGEATKVVEWIQHRLAFSLINGSPPAGPLDTGGAALAGA